MTENTTSSNFIIPTKQVKIPDDLARWEKSEAYQEYLGFIQMIGDMICGKKIQDEKISKSEPVEKLVSILDTLDKWTDEIKPIEQQQRFGNKAFRIWHEKLTSTSEELLKDLIKDENAINEVQVYLHDSFGNSTRIDYGTGHEMAFVMFLACLFHVGVFEVKKDAAV